MNISRLNIKGFRSFDSNGCEFEIKEKLIAFIGANSSGKSAAVAALRKMFGLSSSERELVKEDFHVAADDPDAQERLLSIEVVLSFEGYEKEAVPHYFTHMVMDGVGESPYVRLRLESKWEEAVSQEDGIISSSLLFIKAALEDEETDEHRHPCPPHIKSLIQIIYIPAIRKPDEQLRYAAGSIFYRVLKKIAWSEQFKSDFDKQMTGIEKLFHDVPEFNQVTRAIDTLWKRFHKDKRYEDATLNFGGTDYDAMLRKIEISFDPSGVHRPYTVKDLGDGYRSLFYITLVCALLQVEETIKPVEDDITKTGPLLTILAVEEPENHIAPQLLGRVVNNLIELAKGKKSQIVLTSHTPAIIKRIQPEAIFHFRIDPVKYKSVVKTIRLPPRKDEAYKYVKEAVYNFPEIYFAKLVVIGEGDSEQVIFNKLAQVYGVNFDDNMITFAPLGHRFVNHIWKLLKRLDIPFVTLLDLDMEREGGGWGRIKYIIDQLMLSGVPAKDLVTIKGGKVLNAEEIEAINGWSLEKSDVRNLLGWARSFNQHQVYYSSPLDIDFLMLENFTEAYKATIPAKGGPRIPDKTEDPDGFTAKVNSAVSATLKSEKATGKCYSEAQRELMIYYNYLFLGRGKPTTHILALSELEASAVRKNLPDELVRFIKKIFSLLEIPYEEDTEDELDTY